MSEDKEIKTVLGCLGLMALWVVWLIVSAIINGWALSLTWGWFIVPLFGLPSLTIMQAIGIGLVIGFLTSQYQPKQEQKDKSRWAVVFEAATYDLIRPLFVVAFGYVLRGFL